MTSSRNIMERPFALMGIVYTKATQGVSSWLLSRDYLFYRIGVEVKPISSNGIVRRQKYAACIVCRSVLHIPQTYISCVKGRYSDANDDYITRKEVINIVKKIDVFCAKKSRDTNNGRYVQIVSAGGITEKHIEELFDSIGKNFLFQEVLQ